MFIFNCSNKLLFLTKGLFTDLLFDFIADMNTLKFAQGLFLCLVNLKIQCVTFVYFNYLFHAIFGVPIWSNKMLILMMPCILSTNNYILLV